MQVGTGSTSAPCPLGYREVGQGMKPWPLASPPSTLPTPLGVLIPTTGKGKAQASGGRGGEGGHSLWQAPSNLPSPGSGSSPALCLSRLVPGSSLVCLSTWR